MELYRYLQVLWRRWWVIALLVLVGMGSAGYQTSQQPKVYQATTSLVINPAAPNQLIPYLAYTAGGTEAVGRLAASYSEYMKSRAFAELVVRESGLEASPEAVGGAISTALVPNTNSFKIRVTWTSPDGAQTIANGAADIFIAENLKLQRERTTTDPALAELQGSLDYYDKQVKELRAKRDTIKSAPELSEAEKQEQLAKLQAVLVPLEDLYTKLAAALVANRAGEQAVLHTASVVDRALLPTRPVGASWMRNLVFALLASLTLGIALAFLLDYLDYTVKLPEDLESLLGEGPLGVIGVIAADARGALECDPKLVTAHQPKSPISEAFRVLRTNLQFTALDKPVRSLMITSASPMEGKTLIASNLAVALAQSGKKVALVDADLRRPGLHKMFGLANERGFTNLILAGAQPPPGSDRARHSEATGAAQAGDGISVVDFAQPTQIKNLWVLTSGPLPPNPAEVLGSPQAKAALKELSEWADVVVYDTPPAGPVTDAAVLATKVDGTLMVVKAGGARRDALAKTVAQLKNLGVTVVGTTLNWMRPSRLLGSSYYYHHYYYYYSSPDGKHGTRRKRAMPDRSA